MVSPQDQEEEELNQPSLCQTCLKAGCFCLIRVRSDGGAEFLPTQRSIPRHPQKNLNDSISPGRDDSRLQQGHPAELDPAIRHIGQASIRTSSSQGYYRYVRGSSEPALSPSAALSVSIHPQGLPEKAERSHGGGCAWVPLISQTWEDPHLLNPRHLSGPHLSLTPLTQSGRPVPACSQTVLTLF